MQRASCSQDQHGALLVEDGARGGEVVVGLLHARRRLSELVFESSNKHAGHDLAGMHHVALVDRIISDAAK